MDFFENSAGYNAIIGYDGNVLSASVKFKKEFGSGNIFDMCPDHSFERHVIERNESFGCLIRFINGSMDFVQVHVSYKTNLYVSVFRADQNDLLRQATEQTRLIQIQLSGFEFLNKMSDLLQLCNSGDDLKAVLSDFVPKLFPNDSGSMYVLSPSKDIAESMMSWGIESPTQIKTNDCWALRRGRVHKVPSVYGKSLLCDHNKDHIHMAEHICIPLVAQGDVLGVFSLSVNHSNIPHTLKENLATALSDQFSFAFSNLTLRQNLQYQSIRDPLTGLYNRRYMQETFIREIKRAERTKTKISVIMMDVDHFKAFNDTYGHVAADKLLKEFGQLLQSFFREDDVVCRYGGEEFIAILPSSDPEFVKTRIEKLLKRFIEDFGHRWEKPVTFSSGISSYPVHGTDPNSLIEKADGALYQSKKNGRAMVTIAE